MEAKDTVLKSSINGDNKVHFPTLEEQAEISFQAGMQKVVDFVNHRLITIALELPPKLPEGKTIVECAMPVMNLLTNGYRSAEKWQAFLKENRLEKDE